MVESGRPRMLTCDLLAAAELLVLSRIHATAFSFIQQRRR